MVGGRAVARRLDVGARRLHGLPDVPRRPPARGSQAAGYRGVERRGGSRTAGRPARGPRGGRDVARARDRRLLGDGVRAARCGVAPRRWRRDVTATGLIAITGPAAAGKSTVARAVQAELARSGELWLVLELDLFGRGLARDWVAMG